MLIVADLRDLQPLAVGRLGAYHFPVFYLAYADHMVGPAIASVDHVESHHFHLSIVHSCLLVIHSLTHVLDRISRACLTARKQNAHMTTKIAYLDAGPLLDYWMVMAAAYDPVFQPDSDAGPRGCISKCHDQGELLPVPPRVFRPSTSWSDGGLIIERKHIDLASDLGLWMARHGKRDNYSRADVSPLVSAMRAYLMREYGDGVPTPAE